MYKIAKYLDPWRIHTCYFLMKMLEDYNIHNGNSHYHSMPWTLCTLGWCHTKNSLPCLSLLRLSPYDHDLLKLQQITITRANVSPFNSSVLRSKWRKGLLWMRRLQITIPKRDFIKPDKNCSCILLKAAN